jgi:hypothetical protein
MASMTSGPPSTPFIRSAQRPSRTSDISRAISGRRGDSQARRGRGLDLGYRVWKDLDFLASAPLQTGWDSDRHQSFKYPRATKCAVERFVT